MEDFSIDCNLPKKIKWKWSNGNTITIDLYDAIIGTPPKPEKIEKGKSVVIIRSEYRLIMESNKVFEYDTMMYNPTRIVYIDNCDEYIDEIKEFVYFLNVIRYDGPMHYLYSCIKRGIECQFQHDEINGFQYCIYTNDNLCIPYKSNIYNDNISMESFNEFIKSYNQLSIYPSIVIKYKISYECHTDVYSLETIENMVKMICKLNEIKENEPDPKKALLILYDKLDSNKVKSAKFI